MLRSARRGKKSKVASWFRLKTFQRCAYSRRVVALNYIVCIVAGYLLGSIPTGYLVGKAKGIDIRTVGSGNMGATNVFRVLGKGPGIFVLLVDALKGWLAVAVISQVLARDFLRPNGSSGEPETMAIVSGIAAILGHNYTCWLKFKGGKGIATSAGVLLALVPIPFSIVLATWIVVFAATRYVSLASITAAFILPFAVWLTRSSETLIAITAGLGALAIFKHKANIQRLLNGTENRIGSQPKEPPPAI
jgi:glycerol-3-phosphate acyltransferase PlsY